MTGRAELGWVGWLPTVNAVLNATSAVWLVAGYWCIRRRRPVAHHRCMLVAFGASTVFLVSYLTYHAFAGSRPYGGTGWSRRAYLALLVSHTSLAAVVVPLAAVVLWAGVRGQFARHVRLARWTWPAWLYVSVTGVVIYVILYVVS